MNRALSHAVGLQIWRFMTLLLVGLLLGLSFAHVLERPAKMAYDGELYVTLQRSLYVMWGLPHVGGILEPSASKRRVRAGNGW